MSLFIFYPIYQVVYFQGIHFSLFQIGIIGAIISLFGLLAEIPTGLYADIFGRKRSTILGYCIATSGFLGIYLSNNFYIICLFSALIGIGAAFISGALQAWMTNLFGMKKLAKSFAVMQSVGSLGLLFSGFLGVFVVKNYGLGSIWFAAFIGYVLVIILFLTIKDSKSYVQKKKLRRVSSRDYLKNFQDSLRYISKKPSLKYFLVAMFFMGFALAFTQALVWIPFFEGIGYPTDSLGILWSLMAAAAFLGPLIGLRLSRYFSSVNYFIITIFLWIISLWIFVGINSIYPAILILFLTVLFDQMRYPVERAFLQGLFTEKTRATLGSIESMVVSIAGIIGLPIAGLVADAITPRYTLVLSGILLLPVIFFLYKIKSLKINNLKKGRTGLM